MNRTHWKLFFLTVTFSRTNLVFTIAVRREPKIQPESPRRGLKGLQQYFSLAVIVIETFQRVHWADEARRGHSRIPLVGVHPISLLYRRHDREEILTKRE